MIFATGVFYYGNKVISSKVIRVRLFLVDTSVNTDSNTVEIKLDHGRNILNQTFQTLVFLLHKKTY